MRVAFESRVRVALESWIQGGTIGMDEGSIPCTADGGTGGKGKSGTGT